MVETITTFTAETTSSRVGQTTLRSSATHSFPKVIIFDISTPFHETGQEGLEPSTFGFGDRRSTIRATDLYLKVTGHYNRSDFKHLFNFCFFMYGMFTVKRTILT